MNFHAVIQVLFAFPVGLVLFFSPSQSDAQVVQANATKKFADKLLKASEKCKPTAFKPYEDDVAAYLNAGRHDEALELMKFEATTDPIPHIKLCFRNYAFSMGRAGRGDEVHKQLSFFKDIKAVQRWMTNKDADDFEAIYRSQLLKGTALYHAEKNDLDQAIETIRPSADSSPWHGAGAVKQIVEHLVGQSREAEAAKAIKVYFGDNSEGAGKMLRTYYPVPEDFDLALLDQYPQLAIHIVQRWKFETEKSNQFKWKTFKKIAQSASPEELQAIELKALQGSFLPVEYENRIVDRALKQISELKADSSLEFEIFFYFLRQNKLEQAKELFDSADPDQILASEGSEFAQRLFNAGKTQAAFSVLDRVIDREISSPPFAGAFGLFETTLKLGQLDAAAALIETQEERHSKEVEKEPAGTKQDFAIAKQVLKLHRAVHNSGFSSAKPFLDALKAAAEEFSEPTQLQQFRDEALIDYLIAELAIEGDSETAYEAAIGLPAEFEYEKEEVGSVMTHLLARGQLQKAIEYAKCWQDSPIGSFRLGSNFFYQNSLDLINDELRAATEQEIFQAIGPKLLKDHSYMDYAIDKALKQKNKEEAFRLAELYLDHYSSVQTAGFTKLNWHEDLIALAKRIKGEESAYYVVESVSDDLFKSKQIDELIVHLEKHASLISTPKQQLTRFKILVNFAARADDLYRHY